MSQTSPQAFVMAPLADIEAAIEKAMQKYIVHLNAQPRPDGYLLSEEAAQYMGVSTQTLATQRYRCVGPPYIRDGKIIRYKKKDIDTYMEHRKIKTTLEG